MTRWVPILCREFSDVPRMFFVRDDEQLYLFHCERRPGTKEYGNQYQVYLMPEFTEETLQGSWAEFPMHAIALMGEITVAAVAFAEGQMDVSIFDQLYGNPN